MNSIFIQHIIFELYSSTIQEEIMEQYKQGYIHVDFISSQVTKFRRSNLKLLQVKAKYELEEEIF